MSFNSDIICDLFHSSMFGFFQFSFYFDIFRNMIRENVRISFILLDNLESESHLKMMKILYTNVLTTNADRCVLNTCKSFIYDLELSSTCREEKLIKDSADLIDDWLLQLILLAEYCCVLISQGRAPPDTPFLYPSLIQSDIPLVSPTAFPSHYLLVTPLLLLLGCDCSYWLSIRSLLSRCGISLSRLFDCLCFPFLLQRQQNRPPLHQDASSAPPLLPFPLPLSSPSSSSPFYTISILSYSLLSPTEFKAYITSLSEEDLFLSLVSRVNDSFMGLSISSDAPAYSNISPQPQGINSSLSPSTTSTRQQLLPASPPSPLKCSDPQFITSPTHPPSAVVFSSPLQRDISPDNPSLPLSSSASPGNPSLPPSSSGSPDNPSLPPSSSASPGFLPTTLYPKLTSAYQSTLDHLLRIPSLLLCWVRLLDFMKHSGEIQVSSSSDCHRSPLLVDLVTDFFALVFPERRRDPNTLTSSSSPSSLQSPIPSPPSAPSSFFSSVTTRLLTFTSYSAHHTPFLFPFTDSSSSSSPSFSLTFSLFTFLSDSLEIFLHFGSLFEKEIVFLREALVDGVSFVLFFIFSLPLSLSVSFLLRNTSVFPKTTRV